MSIKGRLNKLEKAAGQSYAPGECPHTGAIVTVLTHLEGEPVPPVPENAPRCPMCGEVQVNTICIEVVDERREGNKIPLGRAE
jgi:hypothetical protein